MTDLNKAFNMLSLDDIIKNKNKNSGKCPKCKTKNIIISYDGCRTVYCNTCKEYINHPGDLEDSIKNNFRQFTRY